MCMLKWTATYVKIGDLLQKIVSIQIRMEGQNTIKIKL